MAGRGRESIGAELSNHQLRRQLAFENRAALLGEASRLAEAKLAAQLQTALGADQRATVLGGIYLAAATGILGAVAASAGATYRIALSAGGFSAAVIFGIGAYHCFQSCQPIDFHLPGNEPSKWAGDIDVDRPVQSAIREQLNHFDAAIEDNNGKMEQNAALFARGSRSGLIAPIVGIGIALLVYLIDGERQKPLNQDTDTRQLHMAPGPSEPTKKTPGTGTRDAPKPQGQPAPRPAPVPQQPPPKGK